MTNHVLHN